MPHIKITPLRIILVVVLIIAVVLLAGCADKSPHKEKIEGVDCIVRKDGLGRIVAMSCDWGEEDPKTKIVVVPTCDELSRSGYDGRQTCLNDDGELVRPGEGD